MVNPAPGVVAFIPVRGGSKSIPLKNIRPLCGKPLVCWCIEALEQTPEVERVVVATDSDAIEAAVRHCHASKVEIYRRSPANATDEASTESVMLEYLAARPLPPSTPFMLVQATSPLTLSGHFSGAVRRWRESGADSLLSCVRTFRFFWDEQGHSINYDYRRRPRRQNFAGNLMENGALYISTAGAVIASGNRISGSIAIYEMPPHTATEIDEPDDWAIMEMLARRHCPLPASPVRLFVTDVDGTLTDGGMYYGEHGDELKKFNTRDGMAFRLLRERGILTAIVTSETTALLERRGAKLKVDHLVQGSFGLGKLDAVRQICQAEGISLAQTSYIGDDINCIPLLQAVGHAACPADAHPSVKALPGIRILSSPGGHGAVREFADILLHEI